MSVKILKGDCRDVLRSLDADSVQTCITSPPYWGLRDYGIPPSICRTTVIDSAWTSSPNRIILANAFSDWLSELVVCLFMCQGALFRAP